MKVSNLRRTFPSHNLPELRVGDLAVSVLVHGVDHLVYLLVSDLPRQVHQGKLHLLRWNTALVILAKGPERVLEVGLAVHLLGLLLNDETKVVEVQRASSVVNLVDEILHLHVGGILSRPPHSVLEILNIDP